MENNQIIPRDKKTLFQYLCYFGSIIASYSLGWFNRISFVTAYPYSKPHPSGWAGLATFLGMYGILGGVSLKNLKTNPNQKRTLWILIGTILTGISMFVVGIVKGVKNPNAFTAGTLYGVYSHQSSIKKKK